MEEAEGSIAKEVKDSKVLHWNYHDWAEMPEELFEHGSHVASLFFKENLLERIPSEVVRLESLTELHLEGNILSDGESTKNLFALKSISVLDLGNNRLEEFGVGIAKIKDTLTFLNLAANSLKELPDEIGELTNLEHLHLCKNHFAKVPKGISSLSKLKLLDLSHNHITKLDNASFRHCHALEALRLQDNLIEILPSSLGLLPKLEVINVSLNQLSCLPTFPFASVPRVMCNGNPGINALPFNLACEQTVPMKDSFEEQIGDDEDKEVLIEMQCEGCFQYEKADLPLEDHRQSQRLQISFGDDDDFFVPNTTAGLGRSYSVYDPQKDCFLDNRVPSLLELSLRRVYEQCYAEEVDKIELKTAGMSLITRRGERKGSDYLEDILANFLCTKSLQNMLIQGPLAFCSNTKCSSVMFDQPCLAFLIARLKDNLFDFYELFEMVDIREVPCFMMFCGSSCLRRYLEEGKDKTRLQKAITDEDLSVKLL